MGRRHGGRAPWLHQLRRNRGEDFLAPVLFFRSLDCRLVATGPDAHGLVDSSFPTVAFPAREMFVNPLRGGLVPTDVVTKFLAFDPLVLVNFLLLGPNNLRKRVLFTSLEPHLLPPPCRVKRAQTILGSLKKSIPAIVTFSRQRRGLPASCL